VSWSAKGPAYGHNLVTRLRAILISNHLCSRISLLPLPEDVDRSVRESDEARLTFYLNLTKKSQRIESAPGDRDALDRSSVPQSDFW
jgi:hypothetical protein